jgi:hypothetical protein
MRPEGLGNLIKIFHLIGSRILEINKYICNIRSKMDEFELNPPALDNKARRS